MRIDFIKLFRHLGFLIIICLFIHGLIFFYGLFCV